MGVVKLADYRPQLEVVEHRVADTEDGFMRVANEITDSLLMADLTVRQLKVMLAIMRKTYGSISDGSTHKHADSSHDRYSSHSCLRCQAPAY